MHMYVILALVALLVLGVSCLTAYLITATRRARKRQVVAARLNAVAARAEQEHEHRQAAAKVSTALTTVLPAIKPGDQEPRRVA
jgi:Flp pilus assembly protein TadB